MKDKNTRLADARQREAKAREEYEAAVAAVAAHPGKRRGWRERQRRAVEAFHAHTAAKEELADAEAAAGLRKPLPDSPKTDADALLVALVRILSRAFAAMSYGPTSPAEMVEDGVAMRYRMDFDLYDDDPPARRKWIETVRARFAAAPEDADAFRCVRVGVVDPAGETAAAIAAALDRAGEG